MTIQTIKFADLEIFYREKGTGETLLIFPDHLHTSAAYREEIDYFAGRFHALAFDYPGRGRSTREAKYPDEQAFDLWNFWADLACHLLMELEIESCYALGVGGGARAALHFAGKQAGQHGLTALGVLADSFLADLDGRTLHRALDTREHFYVRNEKRLAAEHGEDWRQVVDGDTAVLRQIADRGGYAVHDYVLNRIPCPVLLTGHLQDPLRPGVAAEYARLAALIPQCSLYLAAGPNHPYLEHPFLRTDPATFRAVADRFLAQTV